MVWLYKLVEGVATSSFGTHVANLAGVPMDIVQRAELVSQDFSRQFTERLAGRTIGKVPVAAQSDFAFLSRLIAEKLTLDGGEAKQKASLKILKLAAAQYASK